jgi:hypothetical protein
MAALEGSPVKKICLPSRMAGDLIAMKEVCQLLILEILVFVARNSPPKTHLLQYSPLQELLKARVLFEFMDPRAKG